MYYVLKEDEGVLQQYVELPFPHVDHGLLKLEKDYYGKSTVVGVFKNTMKTTFLLYIIKVLIFEISLFL